MANSIEELVGTSGVYDASVAEALGIDISELEDRAADAEICRCAECGWWVNTSETEDRDGEPVCEDCRT